MKLFYRIERDLYCVFNFKNGVHKLYIFICKPFNKLVKFTIYDSLALIHS